MVTIKEIARRTGVSAATVSNVLNHKPGAASEAKTQEILSLADELHYMPNSLAKSLKNQRSKTIGIITEDLTVFNTPEIVDGVEAFCEENGYETILGNMRLFKRYSNDFTDTPRHRQLTDAMIRSLVSKQVEGIVYVGYHCRKIDYLPTRMYVPFVYAHCYHAEGKYPAVLADDEKAAYEVTQLLVAQGHKSIGVISGPIASYHTHRRLEGYQKALFDNGILYNAGNVAYGDWQRQDGYRLAPQLLAAGVTAIFAFNDPMASGVYEYCAEKGLVPGRDVSVFGFDNQDISQGHTPKISTVEMPLHEMGRTCGGLILSQLAGEKRSEGVLVPCTVLPRASLCAPKA